MRLNAKNCSRSTHRTGSFPTNEVPASRRKRLNKSIPLLLIYILLIALHVAQGVEQHNAALIKRLEAGLQSTKARIDEIYQFWQIDKYPNFLKSCFMHKVSWEIMKLKFQKKILAVDADPKTKSKFVISFTGSSVTAGHDSYFNASTPVVTGTMMQAPFDALGVQLESRNAALGNNPCTPYDVCVKYFAGLDADVVHWEQTYFCDKRPIIEQFVRQASFMPSRPVVVFSESQTGHWQSKDCVDKSRERETSLSDNEKALLAASTYQLVSEINRDEFHRAWGTHLGEYAHNYHSAAVQTFQHVKHDAYACMGPYIPTWMAGAASWHPSVIGHKMRAAHHSYFWLNILKHAIEDLQADAAHRQLDALVQDVDHHLDKFYEPVNPPKHKSEFPDQAKCYTDYEPRPVREASLKAQIISGLKGNSSSSVAAASAGVGSGWEYAVYENLVDKKLVQKSLKMGYLDFKYLVHGNQESGPVSFKIDLSTAGNMFLCETPGIWGSLPKGFGHLWEVTDAYLTENVANYKSFAFNKDKAKHLFIRYEKTLDICSQLQPDKTKKQFNAGKHVLTVVPKSETRAIVAWIITP